MKVELLRVTDKPEELISAAARQTRHILNEKDFKSNAELLHHIIEAGHLSVFEHVNYTFLVKDISIVTARQFMRHRLCSYTELSRRYTKEPWKMVLPDIQNRLKPVMMGHFDVSSCIFTKLVANGVSLEDARYIMPVGCATDFIVTMNARQLRNVIQTNSCVRVQRELRELIAEMFRLVRTATPNLMFKLGPYCVVHGHCNQLYFLKKECKIERMENCEGYIGWLRG